ncbi:MAG: PqqD family protein [Spirochaetales bacterium]|nr:PqqD family protein [Spirochaetales bacterium]MBR5668598.1 PqqD family protein [Spirochaetales bacterium]
MKLKKGFITYDTEEESMLIPSGSVSFSGLVKGNRTLGAILALLKEETTESDIVAALARRFDAPRDVIAADVAKALSELRRIGALDE